MAKKKIYAVRKGRKTGLFETWDACKASVDGFSGAEYKGFWSKEEADAYLAGAVNAMQNTTTGMEETSMKGADGKSTEAAKQILAYVDGSYSKDLGKYSFGCVIIKPDGEILQKSGNGDDPESLELRNVTGEMLGAMYAVKWCEVNGYSSVKICYDYMGIEMWATGGWKANKDLTQKYAAFMRESAARIHISFQKIAAHTGNRYNEEADKLAKAALVEGDGIPQIKREQGEGE